MRGNIKHKSSLFPFRLIILELQLELNMKEMTKAKS